MRVSGLREYFDRVGPPCYSRAIIVWASGPRSIADNAPLHARHVFSLANDVVHARLQPHRRMLLVGQFADPTGREAEAPAGPEHALLQARRRPTPDGQRQDKPTQEIAEIAGDVPDQQVDLHATRARYRGGVRRPPAAPLRSPGAAASSRVVDGSSSGEEEGNSLALHRTGGGPVALKSAWSSARPDGDVHGRGPTAPPSSTPSRPMR